MQTILVDFDAFLFFLLACHAESMQSTIQEAQAEKLREAKVWIKCPALKVSLFEPQVTLEVI